MARSRLPQDIDKENWYYENLTHLLLVHEVRDSDGKHIRTDSVKIPWRKIRASLERVGTPKKLAARRR
jgi:hypothetical protein